MRSQRYAIHILADKRKVTLDAWERMCLSLRDKGVDTDDDTVFVHGYGDCYMVDLIYEQAMAVLRTVSSSGMEIVSIATYNGVGEPMDWIYRASEPLTHISINRILEKLRDYNLAIKNGEKDGYPHDDAEDDMTDEDDDEEDE